MNCVAARMLLRSRPWPIYLVAGFAALGLKAHYSRAGAGDLAWILAPTAWLVGWWRGQPLLRDPDLGWRAADGSFVIAPACAGVNFLIVVFTVAVLGFAHRHRSPHQRLAWLAAAGTAAYVLTVTVNALRIVIAVQLYGASIYGAWLTPERVHRVAGTAIYLVALWIAWAGFDHASGRRSRARVSSSWTALLLVPGAYVGVTVVIPLVNGAGRHFGSSYIEHAITVSLVAACTIPLLSLWRWATSGSLPPRRATPRDEGRERWTSR